MSTGLVKAIKSIAIDAVDNAIPMELKFGKVTRVDPLEIQVSHVLTLPAKVLTIPPRITEDSPLKVNDKLALLRQQGGNNYYVLDRLNERSDE